MTTITLPQNTRFSTILRTVCVKPFAAIGRGLVNAAERNGTYVELKRLSETADDVFVAQGTTREKEIRRTVGGYL